MRTIQALPARDGLPFHTSARSSSRGLAALREAAAVHLSPAGQLQVATSLDMLAAIEARMEVLRQQLLHAARHLAGARALQARLYGVGPLGATQRISRS